MEGATAMTMLGEATEFLWTQFTNVATTLTSNAIFLLPVAIFAVGAGIGLAKRLIGR